MVNLAALKAELVNDPIGFGYQPLNETAESDLRVFFLITDPTRRLIFAPSLKAADIARNIDAAEYVALTDAARDYLSMILAIPGDIDMTVASKNLAGLQFVFANAVNTKAALGIQLALRVSRAHELGFEDLTVSDISNARNLQALLQMGHVDEETFEHTGTGVQPAAMTQAEHVAAGTATGEPT